MRRTGQAGSAAATAVRMVLLLVLGLVLLGRALEYVNDRLTDASRGPLPVSAARIDAATRVAEAVAAAEGAAIAPPGTALPGTGLPETAPIRPQPAARVLPPPPDSFVHALQTSDAADRGSALRLLRGYASTPELQAALAVAASAARSDWDRRYIACLRGRDPATPLANLFEALPAAPPEDGEWRGEPVDCLVETIASRAAEDPERAGPLLAVRTLYGERGVFTDALVRLDPQPLPAEVVAALEQPGHRLRRHAAVTAAVALGAATSAADDVRRWLDDGDPAFRLRVLRSLVRRGDDASLALAAAAFASSPGDADVEELALRELSGAGGLDRRLAALAADPRVPNFARAQAVHLVGHAGGEAASRAVAALTDRDATVQPELAVAMRLVVQRFGARGAAR